MRRALAAFVACSVLAAAAPARAREPDPWFGPDKALHFGASAAISASGYGIGTALWPDRTRPLVLGAGLGAAAGVGKEVLDLAGFGEPSWRDLAWDGIGVVVGLALAWSIDLLVRGVSADHPAIGAASSAVRF